MQKLQKNETDRIRFCENALRKFKMYCLSSFCYCCLKEQKELININETDDDNTSYQTKLEFCRLVKHNDKVLDDIKKLLCRKCVKDIDFIYSFRKTFLEKQEFLRSYILTFLNVNTDFINSRGKLSVDVINVDKFLRRSSINSNEDNLSEDVFLIDENSVVGKQVEDGDLYNVDVQTVNFNLKSSFLEEKSEDQDINDACRPSYIENTNDKINNDVKTYEEQNISNAARKTEQNCSLENENIINCRMTQTNLEVRQKETPELRKERECFEKFKEKISESFEKKTVPDFIVKHTSNNIVKKQIEDDCSIMNVEKPLFGEKSAAKIDHIEKIEVEEEISNNKNKDEYDDKNNRQKNEYKENDNSVVKELKYVIKIQKHDGHKYKRKKRLSVDSKQNITDLKRRRHSSDVTSVNEEQLISTQEDNNMAVRKHKHHKSAGKHDEEISEIAGNRENLDHTIVIAKEENDLKIVIKKSQIKTVDFNFKCKICDMSFSLENDLKIHSVIHQNMDYTCIYCDCKFENNVLLKEHERLHAVNQQYLCKICNRYLSTKYYFKNHVENHFGRNKYRCDICDKNLSTKISLINHQRARHGKIVDELKPNTEDQNTSLKISNTVSPIKINYKSIKSKNTEKDPDYEYKKTYCNICNLKFSTEQSFIRHKKHKHTFHKCKFCHRSFISIKSRNHHANKCEKAIKSENVENIDSQYIFKCEFCPKKFNLNIKLRKHLRKHSTEFTTDKAENSEKIEILPRKKRGRPAKKDELTAELSKILGEKQFVLEENDEKSPELTKTCQYCNMKFINQVMLNIHLLLHTGANNFRCEFCSNLFASKSCLESHISRMHKFTLIKCLYCPKTFKNRINFNKHVLSVHIHVKIKHECNFCDKAFLKRKLLREHLKTHSVEERCYPCSVCEKKFIFKDNLIRHLTSHSKRKDHKCQYCTKKFKYYSSLYRHVKDDHKENKLE